MYNRFVGNPFIWGSPLCVGRKWLKHSVAGTYADDMQSSVSGRSLNDVKEKMEDDAIQVLTFMASNGLFANPKKTVKTALQSIQPKKQSNLLLCLSLYKFLKCMQFIRWAI